METLKITEKITFNEFIKKGYSSKLAKNFGMEHIKKSNEKKWLDYSPEVFICEAGSLETYGLGFIVMLRYEADGINFLKRLTSYGSGALTSGGLREAYSSSFGRNPKDISKMLKSIKSNKNADLEIIKEIEHGLTHIKFGSKFYDKCEANRKIWRNELNHITLY